MGRTTQGRRSSRTKRARQRLGYHRMSIILISAVLMLLIVLVSVNSISLQAKNKSYAQQEQELQQEIEAEKERTKEIEEYQAYVGTDEYVEEVAREKLGLVYKNEILFKAAE